MLISLFASIFQRVGELSSCDSSARNGVLIKQEMSELLERIALSSECGSIDPRLLDNARFAVTAWLDEVVMNMKGVDPLQWSSELLQKRYYDTTQAGELFYTKLENSREEVEVLEVYFACLSFGYKGTYGDKSDEGTLEKIKKSCIENISHLRGDAKLLIENTKLNYIDISPSAPRDKRQAYGFLLVAGLSVVAFVLYFIYKNNLTNLISTVV